MHRVKVRLARQKEKKPKEEKFDFERMKREAANDSPHVRKQAFLEYFARFEEFPSYLFDIEPQVDARLLQTINDLLQDPDTPKTVRNGVELLMRRLPV